MKSILSFALALVLVGSSAIAAELKSGLQPGDLVPAFDVEKCGGAVNDGKEVGDNFCYRCMLGNKPVVMVFARKTDKGLASLVKELDKTVTKNADQKLSSFVNLIGPNPSELKSQAKEFAAANQVENVALVVPQDNENGPAEFKISPNAEVTVTIYRNGKVAASHALASGELNDKAVKSIIADTSKILK
jgi:hypothetical protein